MDQESTRLSALKARLKAVHAKEHRVRLVANSQRVGAATVGFVATLVLLELVFNFSSAIRTAFVVTLGFAVIAGFGRFIAGPLLSLWGMLQDETLERTAARVGNYFPAIRDRLLNAVQLEQELLAPAGIYSSELLRIAVSELARESDSVDLMQSVDTSPNRQARKPLLLSLVAPVIIAAFFPGGFFGAASRLWHFDREFIPPATYLFEVSPGNAEIIKGVAVPVAIRVMPSAAALGKIPATIVLFRKSDNQAAFEQSVVPQDSTGSYRSLFADVRSSTEYFAQAGDAKSTTFKLTVLDRPILRSMRVRLEYPLYTGLAARIQEEFVGDITALVGTRAIVSGVASKLLKSAELVLGTSSVRATVNGDTFSAGLPLKVNGSYTVAVVDEQGLSSLDPVRYQIRVVNDEPPSVSIVEPGRNLDVAGNETLSLLIQSKDDFGFSKTQLGYRLIKSRYEKAQEQYTFLPISIADGTTQELETIFPWPLSSLHFVPEDAIEYFVEVFDNDAVSGPKSGRSNLYQLRLPSLEEVFTDVNKTQEESLEELKENFKDAEKLKEEVREISNDLKKNKEVDWTKQKKLEEMAKRYEEMQKKLDQVGKKLEDMTQQMNQQNALSKETLEKFLELQQLFQQMNTEELQKALQKMQQPMMNVSKEAMQQMMKQVEFSEERLRQSIERTLNLLKRIQIEQQLDEVKKRAEALAKDQESLAKQSESAADDPQKQDQLAKQQSDLAKQEQRMEAASKELQSRMEEFYNEMPTDQLREFNEQLRAEDLAGEMQQAAQQLQRGQLQQAGKTQKQIAQKLQQKAEQISDLQRQMMQNQAQAMMNELRRATNNLLELSKQEEAIKQQAQNAPANSAQLRENQQRQLQTIQDLNNVMNSLADLAQKSFAVTPEMGKAIGEANARMGNAMRNLDVRNGQGAAQEQQAAMSALNDAATQVQNALQAMMQQGGGSGMGSLLQQLQTMAGQQQRLNLQTQQIPGQGQLSMQQAAEAARIAKEQEAVGKSLEELNKEAQQSQEGKRILGDLQKIAEEMREVVRNLEQQQVNPETIQKQERILSRLLDASKSQRERDFEKKRKAERGTQLARKSPHELDARLLENAKLRQDLLKSLEQKYSKDYRDLIRRYFEELEKRENTEN